MKKLLLLLAITSVFASCKTSKDYLQRSDEDKTLYDVVKKLSKSPNDEDAIKAMATVYEQVEKKHLAKIKTYSSYKEITRWDKIIDEYSTLQKMYDAINASAGASKLVTPTNYQSILYDTKQLAAEDYYQQAIVLLDNNDRDKIKKSYTYFKKADKIVGGYKDAKQKMKDAFDAAVIDVVINPVQDNSYFFNTGWGNTGYNYSNEYFQQNLVRELGGQNTSRYPAKFYTEWEARRDNVKPTWVVNLVLRNLDIPRPTTYTSQRNVSKSIENGRDTAGNKIYRTVYATIYTNRESFTARAEMDLNITDVSTRRNISYNTFNDDYSRQQESATYSGDSQALSNSDWDLINNGNRNGMYNQPSKEDVLSELYKRIYPQVRNKISYAVDW